MHRFLKLFPHNREPMHERTPSVSTMKPRDTSEPGATDIPSLELSSTPWSEGLPVKTGIRSKGIAWHNIITPTSPILHSTNGHENSPFVSLTQHTPSITDTGPISRSRVFLLPRAERRPPPIKIPTADSNAISFIPYNAPETPVSSTEVEYLSPSPIAIPNDEQTRLSPQETTGQEEIPETETEIYISSTEAPSRTSEITSKRALLIIGSNYDSTIARRAPISPYLESISPLEGAFNDMTNLKNSFEKRGYSVHILGEQDFTGAQMLQEVRDFLASAEAGDVRGIVFTGHSIQVGPDQHPAIVPPIRESDKDTVSADLWDETIRAHTKAGVVVLSIVSTCLSGAFMQQSVRLTNFQDAIPTNNIAASDNPMFITFSSGEIHEYTFESIIPSPNPKTHDHFLWALASTAHRPDVKDWNSFTKTLNTAFSLARVLGSLQGDITDSQAALEWLLEHPQTPYWSATSQNHIPRFSLLLPPIEVQPED